MRDTARLAEVDRARPALIRPVQAPGSTIKLAHSLESFVPKVCSRCDATLAGDRQMTHLADVAPSGPNCSEARGPWAPLVRDGVQVRCSPDQPRIKTFNA